MLYGSHYFCVVFSLNFTFGQFLVELMSYQVFTLLKKYFCNDICIYYIDVCMSWNIVVPAISKNVLSLQNISLRCSCRWICVNRFNVIWFNLSSFWLWMQVLDDFFMDYFSFKSMMAIKVISLIMVLIDILYDESQSHFTFFWMLLFLSLAFLM